MMSDKGLATTFRSGLVLLTEINGTTPREARMHVKEIKRWMNALYNVIKVNHQL